MEEVLERRARVLLILVLTVAGVLVGRLGMLQVVQGAYWQEVARDQRLRLVTTPAPRGAILDRNGAVLATTRPVFTAYLVYTGRPLSEETVDRLARILGLPPAAIREAEARLQPARGRPYEPVPLKVLSEREHALLEENRMLLPGVVVEAQPIRFYPGLAEFPDVGGRLAAHVLGQVRKADRGSSLVGQAGLEAVFNGDPAGGEAELGLQGRDGLRQVEVDVQGRPTRVLEEVPPVPGNNLVLTLDARLQAVAERALQQRMEELRRLRSQECPQGCRAEYGAAVALDVRTGAVLVLASVPSFDPNSFATRTYALPGTAEHRAWLADWQAWQEDPGKPLLNHATQDAAPPGSTFKPVTAVAALEAGVVTPAEEVSCPGSYTYGNHTFKDWRPHGRVNLEEALGRSCDVYFYEMGSRLTIERLEATARAFGLGVKTGLEERDGLPELAGVNAGPEAKRRFLPSEPWFPSERLSAAIGQAQNQFTPLQLAVMTATIANGGTRYKPYVVQAVTAPDGRVLRRFGPEVAERVAVAPATLEAVRRGMLSVNSLNPQWRGTDSPAGTSYHIFGDFPARSRQLLGREIRVAGKTGTAEARKGEEPYGWFVAFAPYEEPEIAVAVMVRHGGGGSLAAGPVARAIMDAYFGLDRTPQAPGTPPPAPPVGDLARAL